MIAILGFEDFHSFLFYTDHHRPHFHAAFAQNCIFSQDLKQIIEIKQSISSPQKEVGIISIQYQLCEVQ